MPKSFGRLERFFQSPIDQDEIDQLAQLDGGGVDKLASVVVRRMPRKKERAQIWKAMYSGPSHALCWSVCVFGSPNIRLA